ncbi:MAG TPA: hypothetical protein VF718_00095 [Allosphingosinicella sp.]
MTKDSKDNRRGCFLFAAIGAVLLAALAWGVATSEDDPRANVGGGAKGATAPVDPAD